MDSVELQCGSRKNLLRHSEFLCGCCICLLPNNGTQELYVIFMQATLLPSFCELICTLFARHFTSLLCLIQPPRKASFGFSPCSHSLGCFPNFVVYAFFSMRLAVWPHPGISWAGLLPSGGVTNAASVQPQCTCGAPPRTLLSSPLCVHAPV